MARFFVDSQDMCGDNICLTGENAAHAKVLRLKQGEEVLVCDGQGNECVCSVDGFSDFIHCKLCQYYGFLQHGRKPGTRPVCGLRHHSGELYPDSGVQLPSDQSI